MPDLLYEIGTEELPAGYIEPAREQLGAALARLLGEGRLSFIGMETAGGPRRLVVSVTGLSERQATLRTTVVGPPARAAFDPDGKPTPAALGFARSKGVPVESLRVEETQKGPYVVAEMEEPGRTAAELLPELLTQATASLPFPKSMRWDSSGFTFARPIRWLVALLDNEVLPLTIAGVRAGRTTYGHRFLSPGPIELRDASYSDYERALKRAHVEVEERWRRDAIKRAMQEILVPHAWVSEDPGDRLLAEVANMVEWPHAIEGAFDERFLAVPAPVVVAAMKGHQRYFPVHDSSGRLLPRFITVADRTAEHEDRIRQGNERVLRARLEDARFYWEHDSRRPLDELAPRLEGVVFLGGLGNNLQRCERLAELGAQIAARMGPEVSAKDVQSAARLCKADLLTGLVGEFPDLQGVVGREIARAHGEPQAVAEAIAEHYLPAGADDALPRTPEGTALALADKLDVLVGCFGLGLVPSGSQDPYALRRNALGILLIIEKNALDLRLTELFEMARTTYRSHGVECGKEAEEQFHAFFRDRLYYAAIERGFRPDFVQAVLAAGWDGVKDFWNRLGALAECSHRDWWPALVELVDRTYRIQRDAPRIEPVNEALLQEPLEAELHAAYQARRAEVQEAFEAGDYVGAAQRYCEAFARLVHDFFEEVFVNVEDEAVCVNRKSLCAAVYRLFAGRFADLYLIDPSLGPA
jgi:glycyl-tRNA synthetase beta chain